MLSSIIKKRIAQLPDAPGVYLFYNAAGNLLYVGKATSLKSRVSSYFRESKFPERSIESVAHEIARIDFIETPTVLEAILKEAEFIGRFQPPHNVLLKDDKSFLWIVFTADEYPRVLLIRQKELDNLGPVAARKKYSKKWGPFTNSAQVRRALQLLRKIFPWSDCLPVKKRPCFNAHIGLCPGVCTKKITPAAYKKNLRRLALFLSGQRSQLEAHLKKEMISASSVHNFEIAAHRRNELYALRHIVDIALIIRHEDRATRLPFALERVEGYDISHLSGTMMVGSMVVFEHGEPIKSEYRKFAIRGFDKSNDTGALAEVISRRLRHVEWRLPTLILVDGGEAQVSSVADACARSLRMHGHATPIIGIAKGQLRKNVRFVFLRNSVELERITRLYRHILIAVRDEAHRFAITFQRAKKRRETLRSSAT